MTGIKYYSINVCDKYEASQFITLFVCQKSKPASAMKIVATTSFIVFFLFLFHLQIFSQSQGNNSLLWRISGNGLSKPSYLFGTMHVYDKRAFNFKDSLYIFLEQAEGFALEFNPDSANQIMEAYMNGSLKTNDEVSPRRSKMLPRIDTAWIKPKQKKNIEKKSKNSEEEKKDMVDEFVTRLVVSDKKQENSMNNFMDAYLYEMARQGQKKMYGLEEMDAQIAALQALQKGVKLKKAEELINQSNADDESPIEKFYYKEDLDSIDIFYRNYFTDEGLDGFLYNRNKGMAAKIDSLVHLQTMFTAIGAAHLPGSKGVIALLKQKGYNLEPVFSSKKIFASDYKLKTSGKPGYVVKEEQMGLEYEIPGKPNSQNGEAGKLVSYYYDLGGGLLYMTICGKLTSKESEQTPEEIVSQLTNQLAAKSQAKIISSKVITSQGLKGLETLCLVKDNAYMRLYEVASKNMFYLFSLSGEKKDNLYSENAEKYLASFKLI
ncbi:MAG TPA: TraB/GumN family protein, partial [Chitinophagaceae bacterium]